MEIYGQTDCEDNMRQTWRWFGPGDEVSITDIRQAGVEGVVSALHHIPTGKVWTADEIAKRQDEIAVGAEGQPTGIQWEVVESLPVSEDIKTQSGNWLEHVEHYKASLENLASAGIQTVCYNFMPVLDWTRTHLAWPLPTGATCMRFEYPLFATFDIFILKRENAANDYPEEVIEKAARLNTQMSDHASRALAANIVSGLPGAAEHFSLDDVREHLARYGAITHERLRQNMTDFLSEVIPVAEQLDIRMCCHPDDPPFDLLGLPRIMSTEADYQLMMERVNSPANGMTLCTGSLGVRPDNDLPQIMERLGDRVHFLHLRNVKRESENLKGSFHEAEHLGGDTDMVAVISAILREEARRKAKGRSDWSIPMRPDHGQNILDDHKRTTQPGYPAIGRLKGLAELRGIMTALSHPLTQSPGVSPATSNR